MSVPMRSPAPRRAARRDEIRRRLMVAVQDELRAGATYSELPLERLARAAGLSRSRFYVYFEDKGDLLRALTEDVFAELFEATVPWWSLPATATEADLRAITEHIFEIFLPHKELLAAVVQVASHDAITRDATASAFEQAVAGYAAQLAEAQRAGRADPALDPVRVTALLSWMTECGLYQLVARTDNTDRHLSALTHIIWNTLYARTRE